jgi:DNA topoisomerase-1
VIQLLENHFHYLIEYGFTSEMENALDEIAYGERDYLQYLKAFYLGEDGLLQQVKSHEGEIDPDRCRTIDLPQADENTVIKVGRYGPYLVHQEDSTEVHASIPEDYAPADLGKEELQELIRVQKEGPKPIGVDPESGLNVYCLVGRYGPYVQLGEQHEDGTKPKRASVPKNVKPSEVDLELALKLLSLPRTLGTHPETGKEIVANNGRFGPFVVHDGDYRSLKKDDDVYSITLERALELLAEEKKGRGKRSKKLKDLGQEPGGTRSLAVYDGKYGPYIKYGSKNISLPEDKQDKESIDALELQDAMEIIGNSKKASGKKASGKNTSGNSKGSGKKSTGGKRNSTGKGQSQSGKTDTPSEAGSRHKDT